MCELEWDARCRARRLKDSEICVARSIILSGNVLNFANRIPTINRKAVRQTVMIVLDNAVFQLIMHRNSPLTFHLRQQLLVWKLSLRMQMQIDKPRSSLKRGCNLLEMRRKQHHRLP